MEPRRLKVLLILAFLAIANSVIYWFACSRPYSLWSLYNRPLFDLFRHVQVASNAHWRLLSAFLILAGLYVIGWRMARHASGRAAWGIILGGPVSSAIVLMLMFPIGAADLFDYIMHARIFSIHGANPFIHMGKEFRYDPFFPYMAWAGLPCTYGPLWVLLSGLAARLAGHGIIANVLIFKLVVGVFFFASIGMIALILRDVAPEHALAGVVAFAWNPIALYETFGNGHNDVVMVFWMLAAVWLLVRRRYTLAILSLMAGALVKYMPILLVPAAGLIALRDLSEWRARLRFGLLTTLVAMALIVLAYLPFWEGPKTVTLTQREDLFTASLPAALWAWLAPQWGDKEAKIFLSRIALTLTILFAFWQARQAYKDRSWSSFPRAGFWILMFYLQFTCLWFQEWYTIWPMALAAVLASDSAILLAGALTLTGLTKPYVFIPLWLWRDPQPTKMWWELRLGPAVLAVPWLSLLAYGVMSKKRVIERALHLPASWGQRRARIPRGA